MTRDTRRSLHEDEFVQKFLDQLETRPCPMPLTPSVLGRMATDALSQEEAERANAHLSECLFCLSAFTRVQGLLESPTPVDAYIAALVESIEQGRAISEKAEPVIAGLQREVSTVLNAVRGAARSFRHRATQRFVSDPQLFARMTAEEPIPLADSATRDLESVGEKSTAADVERLVEQLNIAVRATEESLAMLQTLRHLIADAQTAHARIETTEIPTSIKRALVAQLRAEYQVLTELAHRAASLYGGARP